MNGVEEFHCAARFVRLQVADEMPLDLMFSRDFAQLSDFSGGLLHAVFAEGAHAGDDGFCKARGCDGLTDGD